MPSTKGHLHINLCVIYTKQHTWLSSIQVSSLIRKELKQAIQVAEFKSDGFMLVRGWMDSDMETLFLWKKDRNIFSVDGTKFKKDIISVKIFYLCWRAESLEDSRPFFSMEGRSPRGGQEPQSVNRRDRNQIYCLDWVLRSVLFISIIIV